MDELGSQGAGARHGALVTFEVAWFAGIIVGFVVTAHLRLLHGVEAGELSPCGSESLLTTDLALNYRSLGLLHNARQRVTQVLIGT